MSGRDALRWGVTAALTATFAFSGVTAGASPYSTALEKLHQSAKLADETQRITTYQVDRTLDLPLAFSDGKKDVLRTPAAVTFIPNASGLRSAGKLRPSVLADNHEGAMGRCEANPNARVDGQQQSAELYTPAEAFASLSFPDLAFNTNYFEVRPQVNGTTWQENLCSSPAGVYFSNTPGDHTNNSPVTGNPFLAGLPDYVEPKTNTTAPLDTFFVVSGAEGAASSFELVRNEHTGQSRSLARAQELRGARQSFVGVSGSALLPQLNGGNPQPDSGGSSTTRIALGYDRGNDRLILVQGGGYRDGFTRESLAAVLRALNASVAMEFDGGGSAAMAMVRDKVDFTGASTDPVYFNCDKSLCYSPITQPSGDPRPVPSWMGLSRG